MTERKIIFTDAERKRLTRFPTQIPSEDLITYFTLTGSDRTVVNLRRGEHNRLGFALQLSSLRYLGFCPDDLHTISSEALHYLSQQLGCNDPLGLLSLYGEREHTRTDHFQIIQEYLRFRKAGPSDLENLSAWLIERASEHDKPTLLFRMACERLFSDRIVRPGITTLEKMIISAKQQAQEKIYHRICSLLTDNRKIFLDDLLIPNRSTGRTPLFWLRYGATANTPKAILQTIGKLDFLRRGEVDQWDLSYLNPNRQKFLAQLGRRSTNQALQRMPAQKRYPILVSFLRQSLEDITDELVDLFIRCLSDCHSRSKRDLKEFRLSSSKSSNEKLILFREVGKMILNRHIADPDLRNEIYGQVPEEVLRTAVEECDELIRPRDDKSYDYLGNRFSYLREFTPKFLDILEFRSIRENDSLLRALDHIREMNSEGKRKLPQKAPCDFISKSWYPYVWDQDGKIVRKYYEISALWELRDALRSGDVWVAHSRRYADPESYLIPKDLWPNLRSEACRILGLPEKGDEHLSRRKDRLTAALAELDQHLGQDGNVRIEKGKLVLTPLKAEELPESSLRLKELISQRLPRVELTDLLIEVDSWTRFTDKFEHAGGSQPRTTDLLRQIYASLVAQACNFGLTKMADLSGLTYSQLAWCNNWYIREETLQEAINTLVNYQYRQPLSQFWGGGTMSSSDGQRFPVPIKTRNATPLPRYFGYGCGLTFYSWTSDQFSQYGSKVTPSTMRDSTYVLDAILDNETELQIMEHTTDTAGYTELVFALFDLFGMQFCPRISDLGDQNLYRCEKDITYTNLEPCLAGTIREERILENWDKILRIVASIKLGWVTASLFISKLQAYPRQNAMTKILQEYGRLIKSTFISSYLCNEEKRRQIGIQLNKGEALHDLRRFLFFANEAKLRKSQPEDQNNQASALTLVTNAVIVWNTRYIQAIVTQLREEGYEIRDSDLVHISPCRFEHINKYGKYEFNVEEELSRKGLRPLRKPENP